MNPTLRDALDHGLTCDITTTGRVSGLPRRIEIWYFVVEGRVYITGTPGPRDWHANLHADPHLTFHVKQGASADLPARATLITAPAERRRLMQIIMQRNSYFRSGDLDAWVAASPLVAVEFL